MIQCPMIQIDKLAPDDYTIFIILFIIFIYTNYMSIFNKSLISLSKPDFLAFLLYDNVHIHTYTPYTHLHMSTITAKP